MTLHEGNEHETEPNGFNHEELDLTPTDALDRFINIDNPLIHLQTTYLRAVRLAANILPDDVKSVDSEFVTGLAERYAAYEATMDNPTREAVDQEAGGLDTEECRLFGALDSLGANISIILLPDEAIQKIIDNNSVGVSEFLSVLFSENSNNEENGIVDLSSNPTNYIKIARHYLIEIGFDPINVDYLLEYPLENEHDMKIMDKRHLLGSVVLKGLEGRSS